MASMRDVRTILRPGGRSSPSISVFIARDHDDAVWAGPSDYAGNPGGHSVLVVHRSTVSPYFPHAAEARGDRDALNRGQ